MYIDKNVVKWEDHSVAFNDSELKVGPVSKIKIDDSYVTAISLHKWIVENPPNKGKYISFLVLAHEDEARDIIKNFECAYNSNDSLFDDIQNGLYSTYIETFRFSVKWNIMHVNTGKRPGNVYPHWTTYQTKT